MGERGKIVTARKVTNEAEAVRLKAYLDGQGIECHIHAFYDTALDGISTMWAPAQGCWGEVRVFEEDLPRAEAILADLDKSRPLDDDKPAPEQNQTL